MKYYILIIMFIAQNLCGTGLSGQFAFVYFGEISRSKDAFKYSKAVHGTFSTDDKMQAFFVSVERVESYGNPEADAYLLPEVVGEFQVTETERRYETSSKVLDSFDLEVAAGYFEMLINGLHAPSENDSLETHASPFWERQGASLQPKDFPRYSYYGKSSAETWVLRGKDVSYFLKVDSDLTLSQFGKIIGFLRSESAADYDRFLDLFERRFSMLLEENGILPSCSVIAIKYD